jgi:uncharacterized protein YciI
MHFLVVATDGTDADAPARRARARADHAVVIQKLKDAGNFTLGGHTLDADERIIGSAVVVDFPSRADLDVYLEMEPYVMQGVWQDVKIMRINL